jgi:N-acetyl-anhydromuramyl-L-alanine amidase AmpD
LPLGLQGVGWDRLDPGGAIAALRKVVHAVVLHHDGSSDSRSCFQTLLARGLSTHFMVDRDGTLYQATDVADMAWHAQGMNAVAVGIDLNSTATNLLHSPDQPAPYGAVPSRQAVINGSPFVSWTYSDQQYLTLIALLRVLVDDVGLQPVFPQDQDGGILRTVLADPPAEQFSGIQCHWHSDEQKWDPGPGLDWERILAGLRKEDATFPAIPSISDPAALSVDADERALVTAGAFASAAATRKSLEQSLSSEETASRFLRMLARAVERESGGGYYPVGVNQTWHGGIHIPCVEGTPVLPLLKGELVAAHLGPASAFPRGLGSNNFVLLRHTIPLPARLRSTSAACATGTGGSSPVADEVREAARNDLVVFTLYMHLDGVDWEHPPDMGLVRKLPALRGDLRPPDPPQGPIPVSLPLKEQKDQVAALRAGYVALFSPLDNPAASIVLDTRDVLGFVGEFGQRTGDRRVVHVEVFADEKYATAMDLALYGRYLVPGDVDPARDMVVRSRSLLQRLGWEPSPAKGLRVQQHQNEHTKDPVGSRVMSTEDFQRFFAESGEGDRAALRRLIVRHVSEWSDRADFARAMLEGQAWNRIWQSEQEVGEAAHRWFSASVASWLRFTWLTSDVARHVGLSFPAGQDGMVTSFHPVNFLLWWLFLRSAVRGKPLEEILRCLDGRKSSISEGVQEVLGDHLDLPGQGEWEVP